MKPTGLPLALRPRFSQKQIADAAGVTRMAVYDLERKALKKLKQAIEQEARQSGQSVRGWLFGEA